jgi:hypothetical protein
MKIEDLDIDSCQRATLLSLDYSTCLSIKAYNQPKFESPLKNYRFIENVWVDTLGNIQPQYSTRNPIQQIIRNTSMEPFDRKLTSSNHNCIACHRNAKFDGMFTVNQIVKGEEQR